ncbi:MAG: hypothetical protein JWP91_2704 [Fibrobacteres bacterium]|nr:hypothetical protein [Fibrobacterota bacterium]
MKTGFGTIDQFIAAFPAPTRKLLREVRAAKAAKKPKRKIA